MADRIRFVECSCWGDLHPCWVTLCLLPWVVTVHILSEASEELISLPVWFSASLLSGKPRQPSPANHALSLAVDDSAHGTLLYGHLDVELPIISAV